VIYLSEVVLEVRLEGGLKMNGAGFRVTCSRPIIGYWFKYFRLYCTTKLGRNNANLYFFINDIFCC